MPRPLIRILPALAALAAALVVGCGSGADGGGASSPNASPPPVPPEVARAQHPTRADFPAVRGRTLGELAQTVTGGPSLALATTVHEPGANRVAFGVIDADGSLLYGKTALYVARGEDAPAHGPFPAPADSLQVRAPFRSASDDDVKAIYRATVELPRPGRWIVLSVTRAGDGYVGAAAELTVRRAPAIPAVGDRAPRVHTPTPASVGGDVSRIDTRVPPSDMHDYDLFDVLGRRPVALLVATPALCRSRVCGPVADVALQLKAAYGDRVAFIHNEVYVDNDPSRGLRPQLRAFGLTTEPWLFAIDREGRVAARLEGAFGVNEVREAIEAALSRARPAP